MNIRPDTALHQVISELLGQAGRAVRPTADAPSAPATAAAKKPQAAAVAAPTAGAPAAQSGPTQPRPRGSLINILA